MKPLPKDENNPLAGNVTPDDLILWLAYKEAKTLISFDESPPQRRPTTENRRFCAEHCGDKSASAARHELPGPLFGTAGVIQPLIEAGRGYP